MYKSGESLREISRLFGVNLRRLRRGLARSGLRVAGQDLADGGHEGLAALRDRLGHEPDAVIAEAAGVTVEAVQGERRRLNIPPFRRGVAEGGGAEPAAAPAAPAPVVAAPAVAAPAAPVAPAPVAAAPVVAAPSAAPSERPSRRVALTTTALPERTPREADAPRDPAARREGRDLVGGRDPARPGARQAPWERRAAGGEKAAEALPASPASGSPRAWRRTDAVDPTVVRRPRPGGRLATLDAAATGRSADEVGTGPDMSPEERELARMSDESPRERRGRLRLVRPDVVPEVAPEPEPMVRVRRKKEPAYSPVRVVKPDQLTPVELSQLVASPKLSQLVASPKVDPEAPVAAPAPAPAPVAPVTPAAPALSSTPPTADTLPSTRRAPSRIDEAALLEDELVEPTPPRPSAPVAPPRSSAQLPASADSVVARPRVRPSSAGRAEAAPTAPPAPVAPETPPALLPAVIPAAPEARDEAPAVSHALTAPLRAWLVQVEGRAQPLLILADTIQGAAERAAREVGVARLAAASITVIERL